LPHGKERCPIQVVEKICEHKIVAIARRVPVERIVPIAEALYEGGIRLMEITFDQADPECLRLTPRMIEVLTARFPDMSVGAGTVMTREQARAAADTGARFALAPNIDPDVIDEALKRGMAAIPGALTPTEVAYAFKLGAAMVKLFPAGDLGVGYLKALRGPLPHIPLMAVGGVDLNNLADFFKAGAKAAGIGSNIVSNKLIAEGRYLELTGLAKAYTNLV
jgi:2-dehydro-3-deoxyphosphogluconate aldolase/(4S)-4-hydroxy-2-oxoglutarate aldolase